jgi:hypothetical protein
MDIHTKILIILIIIFFALFIPWMVFIADPDKDTEDKTYKTNLGIATAISGSLLAGYGLWIMINIKKRARSWTENVTW